MASDDGGVFRLRKAAVGLSGLSALNAGGENRIKKKTLKVLLTAQFKIFIRETAADDGQERKGNGDGLPWQQCTSTGFPLAC